jgi:hypothetical protein
MPDVIPERILKEYVAKKSYLAFVTSSIIRYALGAFPPNGCYTHSQERPEITDRFASCLSSAKF